MYVKVMEGGCFEKNRTPHVYHRDDARWLAGKHDGLRHLGGELGRGAG